LVILLPADLATGTGIEKEADEEELSAASSQETSEIGRLFGPDAWGISESSTEEERPTEQEEASSGATSEP